MDDDASVITNISSRYFSEDERQMMSSKLNQKLSKGDLAHRPGPGGQQLSYVEAHRVIELANDIFGFNNWSSALIDLTQDYYEERGSPSIIAVGFSAIVRVTIRDGAFHEDIGYGSGQGQRDQALEKAKKEAVTDATKRALRLFGNKLGNSAYDRNHLNAVKRNADQISPSGPASTVGGVGGVGTGMGGMASRGYAGINVGGRGNAGSSVTSFGLPQQNPTQNYQPNNLIQSASNNNNNNNNSSSGSSGGNNPNNNNNNPYNNSNHNNNNNQNNHSTNSYSSSSSHDSTGQFAVPDQPRKMMRTEAGPVPMYNHIQPQSEGQEQGLGQGHGARWNAKSSGLNSVGSRSTPFSSTGDISNNNNASNTNLLTNSDNNTTTTTNLSLNRIPSYQSVNHTSNGAGTAGLGMGGLSGVRHTPPQSPSLFEPPVTNGSVTAPIPPPSEGAFPSPVNSSGTRDHLNGSATTEPRTLTTPTMTHPSSVTMTSSSPINMQPNQSLSGDPSSSPAPTIGISGYQNNGMTTTTTNDDQNPTSSISPKQSSRYTLYRASSSSSSPVPSSSNTSNSSYSSSMRSGISSPSRTSLSPAPRIVPATTPSSIPLPSSDINIIDAGRLSMVSRQVIINESTLTTSHQQPQPQPQPQPHPSSLSVTEGQGNEGTTNHNSASNIGGISGNNGNNGTPMYNNASQGSRSSDSGSEGGVVNTRAELPDGVFVSASVLQTASISITTPGSGGTTGGGSNAAGSGQGSLYGRSRRNPQNPV